MIFRSYDKASDLPPRVVHSITTPMQFLFFISFVVFLVSFFVNKNILDLLTAVFFLRWSVTTYQLMCLYDRAVIEDYNEMVDKENKLQEYYNKMGRNNRRKVGLKQVKINQTAGENDL